MRRCWRLPNSLSSPLHLSPECVVPSRRAGFQVGFLSGFSVAAARAGAPDTGLLSFAEVLDSTRCAVEVCGCRGPLCSLF